MAGGGSAERSLSGVPAGSGATNGSASSCAKVPRGFESLIVIAPVLSSVTIPEMPPSFVFANSGAPTMSVY